MLTQVQKSKNNTHRKDFERNYKELVLQKSMKGKQIPSHAFLTINFVGVMLVFFLTGTQFGPILAPKLHFNCTFKFDNPLLHF